MIQVPTSGRRARMGSSSKESRMSAMFVPAALEAVAVGQGVARVLGEPLRGPAGSG